MTNLRSSSLATSMAREAQYPLLFIPLGDKRMVFMQIIRKLVNELDLR